MLCSGYGLRFAVSINDWLPLDCTLIIVYFHVIIISCFSSHLSNEDLIHAKSQTFIDFDSQFFEEFFVPTNNKIEFLFKTSLKRFSQEMFSQIKSENNCKICLIFIKVLILVERRLIVGYNNDIALGFHVFCQKRLRLYYWLCLCFDAKSAVQSRQHLITARYGYGCSSAHFH